MFRSACGENRVGMGKLATRFGVLTLACIADAGQTPAQPAQALRRALADGSLSAALSERMLSCQLQYYTTFAVCNIAL